MNQEDYIEMSPEGEELLKVICSYIADALEDVLESSEFLEEEDALNTISKHISKKLDYLEDEGWLDNSL